MGRRLSTECQRQPQQRASGFPWDPPIPFELLQSEKNFLRAHYSPPTDLSLDTLPRELREAHLQEIRSSTRLADMRLNLPEYQKTNQLLLRKSLTGDESSFLKLIARDPRYLCSKLGLLFITKWQSELDVYESFRWIQAIPARQARLAEEEGEKEVKITDLSGQIGPAPFLEVSDRARQCIERIPGALLCPFDRRGAPPIPPSFLIKAWYYAALVLFSGLKRIAREHFPQVMKDLRRYRLLQDPQLRLKETIRFIDDLRGKICEIPRSKIQLDSKDGFLIYIQQVDRHSARLGKGASIEFSSQVLLRTEPNKQAAYFVTKLLGIRERTLREKLRSRAVISWNTDSGAFAVTKLQMRLEAYRPVADLLA